MYINYTAYKCPWDEASTRLNYLVETDSITHRDTYSNL